LLGFLKSRKGEESQSLESISLRLCEKIEACFMTLSLPYNFNIKTVHPQNSAIESEQF